MTVSDLHLRQADDVDIEELMETLKYQQSEKSYVRGSHRILDTVEFQVGGLKPVANVNDETKGHLTGSKLK